MFLLLLVPPLYLFLVSLVLLMSLLLRASLPFLPFQAPVLLQAPGKINSCRKVLFQVTFKTKKFCIAFYKSYSSTVDAIHSRTYPRMLLFTIMHARIQIRTQSRAPLLSNYVCFIFLHTRFSGLGTMQLSTNLNKKRTYLRLTSIYFFNTLKYIHCKKGLAVFPSPAGMSLTKLFLGGNNLIFPAQGEFGQ
jgi:hypothetical protein